MRPPEFWHEPDSLAAALLAPAGALYGVAARLRQRLATPWRAPVPVICVGNLTVGGAGKTPAALALGAILQAWDLRVAFLTRGYGGTLRGPVAVDRDRHTAGEVGDEPLLLAARTPTWVARDRKDGARLAIADGADVVVMDDGLQNPSLAKDLRFVIVDGGYGFGNGRVLPAGPLREPLARGLARADAFILVGDDARQLGPMLARHAPVFRARIVPDRGAASLAGRKVHAFAGIGRPDKFFATVDAIGAVRTKSHAFPDHHPYGEAEALRLVEAAERDGAIAVTTAKDFVRLPPRARALIRVISIELAFDDRAEVENLLRSALARTDTSSREPLHG